MNWIINYSYKAAFLSFVCANQLSAETLLQKEKLDFGKCLEVVETSSKKLNASKNIITDESNLLIVNFEMADGKLTIKCDGSLSEITVFSN